RLQGPAAGSNGGVSPERIFGTHHEGPGVTKLKECFFLCLIAGNHTWPLISAPRVDAPSWGICTPALSLRRKCIVSPTNRWSTPGRFTGMYRDYGLRYVKRWRTWKKYGLRVLVLTPGAWIMRCSESAGSSCKIRITTGTNAHREPWSRFFR